MDGSTSRIMSEYIIDKYFKTFSYPFTHHHINSFDQFIANDIPAIIKSENPILILQEPIGTHNKKDIYAYQIEIFIGGIDGDRFYIGTPTLSLKNGEDVRILFPNEARLRNLSYSSSIDVDIVVRITFTQLNPSGGNPIKKVVTLDPKDEKYSHLSKVSLFKIPIMLHSRYCLLHNKPNLFLKEVGECPYDYGGYFVVDGSEKVLITRQEAAFNTLYISKQENNPDTEIYASIQCLNPVTRQVKRIAFAINRSNGSIVVSIPMVRKEIPLFVLFRAFGVQSDNDILRFILPDETSVETKLLEPYLHETLLEADPFMDQYSAIQYIKLLTKGFSEAHVYDILYNSIFIHCENKPNNKVYFLGECVRKMLRVKANIDMETDRDDIRNQRCLTSGFLIKMLFQNIYTQWVKKMKFSLDKEYKYNKANYSGENFLNLFLPGNLSTLFELNFITEGINRGFKGKWTTGHEDATGALQPLSRLSYLDFLSHCRRVNLDFDTGLALAGPRRLHTTQYGYFCTSETPGGSSIGITKNLSNFTAISLSMEPKPFIDWLIRKMNVLPINDLTPKMMMIGVPIYVNSGIIGYIMYNPFDLLKVCKLMKYTGCLPCYSSMGFNIRERKIFFYFDEGRPVRPLIHIENALHPYEKLKSMKSWNEMVKGTYKKTYDFNITSSIFTDPLELRESVSVEDYINELTPYVGVIEYVDPYESNEAYIAMYPEQIKRESTHVELHPSTMVGLLTSMIPFPNHNQSPRNQLSCSQSKQGISMFSTNYKNRFDNQTHILCYGEAPLVRTLYYDYVADGQIGYGHNIILAIGAFTGYNQEDGIVFNADSFQRGMFRNMTFRSYEAFEEDDDKSGSKTRIANPENVPAWLSLKPGLDYRKLDERGIIKKGEKVDENTVLVGRYIQTGMTQFKDDSVTAQVWTSGLVEDVSVTINNKGLALVKIRVIEDRIPELGDKFSNRHGQKGTIGMLVRAHDMPRTANGIVPDMMMNPHAIPSRMTIAQLLESLLGKAACLSGLIGDGTAFMNEGGIENTIGAVLEKQFNLDKYGEEVMYDGTTGSMIPTTIFMGNVYTMRLKHMVEDKWNARGEGRREQKTHQPTGGRGNQGGLRIGEMERDSLVAHGISLFIKETYTKRADGYSFMVCNGCGTVPITNTRDNFKICSMCDGPLQFIGETANNLELLPTMKRSNTSFSRIELPYSFELLNKEMNTYMNMYLKYLTTKDLSHIRKTKFRGLKEEEIEVLLNTELPERILKDLVEPEMVKEEESITITPEEEAMLGKEVVDEEEEDLPEIEVNQGVNKSELQGQTVMVSQPPVAVMVPQAPVEMLLQPTTTTQTIEQPIQQQQGGSNQQYMLMPVTPTIQPMQIVQAQIPKAPPTLVVDTSPEAMEAGGFSNNELPTIRSILKGGSSRSTSPSTKINKFSTFSVNKLGDGGNDNSSSSSNTRINIVKEGE
uniref:DNA-directed RNA polymerase n=1 Tax=viral metagenome TaxID=1070528 RepID=A0A6C0IDR1_9ZZZZ